LLTAAASLTVLSFAALPAQAAPASGPVRNIVLVHGAFADGSGWKPVADILRKDGYSVSIVQEPETSLEDDVVATNRILDRQSGPAVLVGHSYGGAIITVAGNNPHVASLVYVAAFAPDEGEQVGALTGTNPPAATSIAPTKDGYLLIDEAKFPADFAADLPLAEAKFMAISQVPINAKIFGTPITAPAWKSKPSYGIVATQDRMINPDLERSMYKRANAKVTEVKGSHVIFLSQPKAVADVIEQAAREAK
jgi:pimeloyl-ACP methyl ester carboxylesterase